MPVHFFVVFVQIHIFEWKESESWFHLSYQVVAPFHPSWTEFHISNSIFSTNDYLLFYKWSYFYFNFSLLYYCKYLFSFSIDYWYSTFLLHIVPPPILVIITIHVYVYFYFHIFLHWSFFCMGIFVGGTCRLAMKMKGFHSH